MTQFTLVPVYFFLRQMMSFEDFLIKYCPSGGVCMTEEEIGKFFMRFQQGWDDIKITCHDYCGKNNVINGIIGIIKT